MHALCLSAEAAPKRQKAPQVLNMELLTRLSRKIVNDLTRSDIVKAEDTEIYIYGINQILMYSINISSALIIGLIFGKFFEAAVFIVAYCSMRSFAGGYHAKTPLRCYFFSVIMLIIVLVGIKYLYLTEWMYYVVLLVAALVVIVLSPVEDKNKPLDEIEHRVYKKWAIFIAAAEFLIGLAFKLAGLDNLFVAVVYSFVVLSFMLAAGKVKNHWSIAP